MAIRRGLRTAGPVLAVLALLSVPGAVRAEATKIGYFDIKRILAEVDDARAAKNRLQREFDDKQRQLDDAKTELEKLQKDFQAKQAVLSQSAKEQAAMELQTKLLNANKLFQELQGELAQKEQTALAELVTRLEPVVRDLAEDEGYAYVFEKNDAGLFYAPAGHDLTAQIIRRYNQRFPSKGAAAKEKAPEKGKDKPADKAKGEKK